MRMRPMYLILTAALLALSAVAAFPQATLTRVGGRITNAGQPVANAQITFTNLQTGRTFKGKTDKNGNYEIVGLERTNYQIDVTSATGEKLYSSKQGITGETNGHMGGEQTLDLDISQGGGQPKYTKEQRAEIEKQNEKARNMNELINQVNAALNARNWEGAIPLLQQLSTQDPNRWRFTQSLGDAQLNVGQYDQAVATYEKGIQVAQGFASGNVKDPKNPDADPAKAKAGVAQMLTNEGNAYLKMHKNQEAVAAFTKAASMDPNPATAYFNICATQYNSGNTEGALAACDKAIAADPNRADAYFIKGSLMVAQG
ncbi:MAG TPA: tetratricopeptide repeat protein, partial [Candidatus Acidoferrales bacterium]|nr:tetratricopeptide repeat protein [Candidatus Acidoferrales bacterium]